MSPDQEIFNLQEEIEVIAADMRAAAEAGKPELAAVLERTLNRLMVLLAELQRGVEED